MERPLSDALSENLAALKQMFGTSADFYSKPLEICGVPAALVMFDGISSLQDVWQIALDQLGRSRKVFFSGQKLAEHILEGTVIPAEPDPLRDMQSVIKKLTAGMAVLLIDEADFAIAFSVQNMKYRSVGEPSGEGNVKGSQEGFTDLLRVNISLLRRLIRTPELAIEIEQTGEKTDTEYALCYNKKLAPAALVRQVKKRLQQAPLPFLFDSAYLIPFLRRSRFHLFPEAGMTERSAVAAAKISEGKLIILVNGSPFALILPHFFAENFQTLDDYSGTALFASFIRVVKYIAFLTAVFLPGLYVMAVDFTPEILPAKLLGIVAKAQADTPFPILLEMLLVVLLFEVIREAGLRMPSQLGHSVSLVAALIIGDTAIDVGLMSVPVVFIAAMAMVSSYVVPALYEQTAILRFLSMLLFGLFGVGGGCLSLILLLCAICSQTMHYNYLYPLTPMRPAGLKDGMVRQDWRRLAQRPFALRRAKKEGR